MTCALNFIFNGKEISLPGKAVCELQVAMTWFTALLPAMDLPQGCCTALN